MTVQNFGRYLHLVKQLDGKLRPFAYKSVPFAVLVYQSGVNPVTMVLLIYQSWPGREETCPADGGKPGTACQKTAEEYKERNVA